MKNLFSVFALSAAIIFTTTSCEKLQEDDHEKDQKAVTKAIEVTIKANETYAYQVSADFAGNDFKIPGRQFIIV